MPRAAASQPPAIWWVRRDLRLADNRALAAALGRAAVQAGAGCRLGRDYPMPIVDHARARERAIEAYRRSREGSLPARRRGLLQ